MRHTHAQNDTNKLSQTLNNYYKLKINFGAKDTRASCRCPSEIYVIQLDWCNNQYINHYVLTFRASTNFFYII